MFCHEFFTNFEMLYDFIVCKATDINDRAQRYSVSIIIAVTVEEYTVAMEMLISPVSKFEKRKYHSPPLFIA